MNLILDVTLFQTYTKQNLYIDIVVLLIRNVPMYVISHTFFHKMLYSSENSIHILSMFGFYYLYVGMIDFVELSMNSE